MKVSIRKLNGKETVHLCGYVNAVERESRELPPVMAPYGATDKPFFEIVRAGVFNWSYVGYAAKIKAQGKNCKKSQTKEPAAVSCAVIASKIATKNDLQKITAQLKAQGFTVNTFELKK